MIIAEQTNEVIGSAYVDLSLISKHRSSFQFIPILNDNGNKLGKLHVSLQLTYLTKFQNTQLKMCKYNKEKIDNGIALSTIDNLQNVKDTIFSKNLDNTKENFIKSVKVDMYDTYRSVLKAKRPEFQECKKRYNDIVTDKLITQIVARAQRLRGAILKETYNEDPLILNDSLINNESCSYNLVENEAKLYEYILGKEMTLSEEKTALDTLKFTSPTLSLIDLASETITACENNSMDTKLINHENNNTDTKLNENLSGKQNDPVKDRLRKCIIYIK